MPGMGAESGRDPGYSIPILGLETGLRDRGGNGLGAHLLFLWKGPERKRMMMIMRTWHHPTRTCLPSQVRGLLRGQRKRGVV